MGNLRQKAERGNITSSNSTTRFPQASCFEKTMCPVPEISGHMYNVLPRSARGTRKRVKKSDSRAAEKGVKKVVSSNFAKIQK
jgi:hypothetical protein